MANIKDVAREAGLSVSTVSRVLNNRGYISEETKLKVSQAMETLNYKPNEIARSLFRKKSGVIGLIIPNVSHPYFSELASYIEHYAYHQGYKILLCISNMNQEKERDYMDMLHRNQVDGLIMGSHTLEVDAYLKVDPVVVSLDRHISDRIPCISSDNYEGGRLATQHLIDQGCRVIAHICGSLSLDLLPNLRNKAFRETASANGVEHVTIETDIDVFDRRRYETIASDLMDHHPEIDGVFCSSDIIAAHLIKASFKSGRKVPEDIKIVGYDDIGYAGLHYPSITTIRQPIEEMAKAAVEQLLHLIQQEDACYETVLPVKLVVRKTT